MGGSGFPPRANSPVRRGRFGSANVRLPAEGRHGDPPKFSLPRPSKRELELWAMLWTRPQAVMWESMGCEHVVAGYCRILGQAEKSDPAVSLLGEKRRLEDSLGLSPIAMSRLRWAIEDAGAEVDASDSSDVLDIRERLKAVE